MAVWIERPPLGEDIAVYYIRQEQGGKILLENNSGGALILEFSSFEQRWTEREDIREKN